MKQLTYDSDLEKKHHADLLWSEKAGHISGVEYQYHWDLEIAGQAIFRYTVDFKFYSCQDKVIVCDECKGYFHEQDRIRFKAFVAHHNALGWKVRLQDHNKPGRPFFEVFVKNRKLKYYDPADGKEKFWSFRMKKQRVVPASQLDVKKAYRPYR